MGKRLVGIVGDGNMIKQMRNDQGNNPLHLAASLGQADMCMLMVDRDLELIMSRNMDGETPLFLAALHGRKQAFYTLHYKWSSNRGLLVEELDVESEQNLKGTTAEQSPKDRTPNIPGNYETCFNVLKIFGNGLLAGKFDIWKDGLSEMDIFSGGLNLLIMRVYSLLE
ncbi:hypothetical protein AAC387_Pa06g1988 [Persea americana]